MRKVEVRAARDVICTACIFRTAAKRLVIKYFDDMQLCPCEIRKHLCEFCFCAWRDCYMGAVSNLYWINKIYRLPNEITQMIAEFVVYSYENNKFL